MLGGIHAQGCIRSSWVGTSVIPICTDRETEAQRGEAPCLRHAASEQWRWDSTRDSQGLGEGCPHAPRAFRGLVACKEGPPLGPGGCSLTCPFPTPCAQPHLALDIEDEDSRGGHGGGRRTWLVGREGLEATVAPLPSSCGSARAQVSTQVSAS